MTVPSATKQTARANRLLRSLVGVADVRLVCDAAGILRIVHVLKAEGVRDDQLVRNVVSGLKAGLGMKLAPASVRVHLTSDAFPGAACAPTSEAAQQTAPSADAAHRRNGNGNGNGRGTHAASANGASAGAHRVASTPVPPDAGFPLKPRPDEPRMTVRAQGRRTTKQPGPGAAPQLERIELERAGAVLRCQVSLSCAGSRYSAIAEAPERAGADAELAASVTLDALRAGGFTSARLEGLGRSVVGSERYVVAAVREPAAKSAVAGAAPLGNCPVRAAAEAVLNTLCLSTDNTEAGH
jgi:hypothetical protein